MDKNTCLKIIFGGCKGSKNMFNTKAACENLCLKDKNGEENALTKINGKVIREHITHIRKAESAKVFLFCIIPPFFFYPCADPETVQDQDGIAVRVSIPLAG